MAAGGTLNVSDWVQLALAGRGWISLDVAGHGAGTPDAFVAGASSFLQLWQRNLITASP
ncbi:MAG: hypothetical protein ABF489_01050 [Bifidobacterium sp.]|uniref:hypothetical protein n=1 Tax=Bifidobacterium sp. TaxID=41200 RepID=UPI0039E8489F